MKDLIKQILKEETYNDKLAKSYLSRLKLVAWKNNKYNLLFLATDKGNIIVLISTKDNEISIDRATYNILIKILKNENNLSNFIYDYIIEKGVKLPFNKDSYHIDVSDNVGKVDYEDDFYFNDLNEGKNSSLKTKFAKSWLSKYNDLKKYKSEDGYYIYLVNSNGTIMIQLNTQINETAVSSVIWDVLENHFTEKEIRRKLISWLLDQYHLNDIGYLHKTEPSVLGKINTGDTLIDRTSIQENENKNPLKNYWFKKWSKQREQGEIPSIYEIEKLGLTRKRNEIVQYFTEFMGYNDVNSRSNAIKQYLLNHTFTEKEITGMNYFDQGKIKIKFNSVEFSEVDDVDYVNLDIDFFILSGSFYNPEEGEVYYFSRTVNPFDDLVEFFEFKEGIVEIVENFVFMIILSFGFDINEDFNYINVEII
jgi:hypothetical protein